MQISTIQNTSKSWMKCPEIQAEYPGLAFIYPLDELIIAEYRDNLHQIITQNGVAYTIFNQQGQKVFLAVLEKRFKKFEVKIFNQYGNEVIFVKRPFQLWANKALVWAPPGNYVGAVREAKFCCNTYIVQDHLNHDVLKIVAEGKLTCTYKCKVFKIFMLYGGSIGIVKNNWTADLDVKNFGITFPAELDPRDKAVLLGACFLIGYLKY